MQRHERNRKSCGRFWPRFFSTSWWRCPSRLLGELLRARLPWRKSRWNSRSSISRPNRRPQQQILLISRRTKRSDRRSSRRRRLSNRTPTPLRRASCLRLVRTPLPTQQGKDLPFIQTWRRITSSLASRGRRPQPTPPPPELKSTPEPSPPATPHRELRRPRATPTPVPVTTPEPEQLAMLTATPPPPIREPEEEATPVPTIAASTPVPLPRPRPEQPSSSYQAQKEQTRISGRIGRNGASSRRTPWRRRSAVTRSRFWMRSAHAGIIT